MAKKEKESTVMVLLKTFANKIAQRIEELKEQFEKKVSEQIEKI